MRNHVRSIGFGSLGAIAVVLIVAVIGIGAGLAVRSSRHAAQAKHAALQAKSFTAPAASKTPFYTPPGYTRYTSVAGKFSVAYPSGWGALQPINDGTSAGSLTVGSASLQSGQPDALNGEQGPLMLTAAISGVISMQHQNSFIQSEQLATGYIWREGYGLGKSTGKVVALALHTNAEGVQYYDGSLTGEDGTTCSNHEYVFIVGNGLVSVIAPSLCPLQEGSHIDKATKALYLNQLKAIVNSVVITR